MLASEQPSHSSGPEFPRLIRILVVEDDFGDYDAVVRASRKIVSFNTMVTRAKTLESARRLVLEHPYDVLLIDYNLGVECGSRLLDEIGGRSGRAVPILLTGMLDGTIHELALKAGAISCISKCDLSPTSLETTIRSAMYTHRLEVEIMLLVKAMAANETENAKAMLAVIRDRMPWMSGRRGDDRYQAVGAAN